MNFEYIKAHLIGTFHHTIDAIFFGLVPVTMFGLLVGYFLTRKISKTNELDRRIIYAFSFIGAASGIMIGSSRDSVVHAFLPAMLTIFSTFMAYLYVSNQEFTQKLTKLLDDKVETRADEINQLVNSQSYGKVQFIPHAIIALVISSVVASFYGSSLRNQKEKNQREYDKHLMEFEKIQIPLNYDALKKKVEEFEGK